MEHFFAPVYSCAGSALNDGMTKKASMPKRTKHAPKLTAIDFNFIWFLLFTVCLRLLKKLFLLLNHQSIRRNSVGNPVKIKMICFPENDPRRFRYMCQRS